ncbi:hypothetical protein LTR60_000449 [Cryomyces antarcticus]|nr:hypothetical protein LTR60_000449 [Cryomyces antarcticus]
MQEFFEHLVEYQLAICKRCGHAVWLEQIESHLTGKQHRIGRKKAVSTAEGVRRWSGLIQYPSELRVPDYVEQAISHLPLHQDGLLCQLDPTRCRYVCWDLRTIKWHWRQVREWSVGKKRGRPAQSKGRKVEKGSHKAARHVQCQRFFPSRHGSQYFEVRPPGQEQEQEHIQVQTQAPGEGGNSREENWARLRQKLKATRRSIEDKARSTIQEGEADEVNPWLERAQWHQYLVRLERPELMSCVEEPDKEEEPVEAAIWEAMDGGEEKEDEEEKLSVVQRACLQFCIALLDQRITQREYDSALVCALTVLGVKEGGWKGPDQYPPILSAMIKIARFVVVQQALELVGPSKDDGSDSDSDSGVETVWPRKGCLQFVTEMTDLFMVRGSHGAMQWMLDLRTYGLKIHYNTTSTGNVDWTGDQILYKIIQFSMAEFRSMVDGHVSDEYERNIQGPARLRRRLHKR